MSTVYIMHKAKFYSSTDEVYSYASAHGTRAEAEQAVCDEIASDIDADMDGSDCDELDKTIQESIDEAFAEGEEIESHDAVLHRGDFTAYYDITESKL